MVRVYRPPPPPPPPPPRLYRQPGAVAGYRRVDSRYCVQTLTYASQFSSLSSAAAACTADSRCTGLYDLGCTGGRSHGGYRLCNSGFVSSYTSCVYEPNQPPPLPRALAGSTALGLGHFRDWRAGNSHQVGKKILGSLALPATTGSKTLHFRFKYVLGYCASRGHGARF
jgi:hypothetical protein